MFVGKTCIINKYKCWSYDLIFLLLLTRVLFAKVIIFQIIPPPPDGTIILFQDLNGVAKKKKKKTPSYLNRYTKLYIKHLIGTLIQDATYSGGKY